MCNTNIEAGSHYFTYTVASLHKASRNFKKVRFFRNIEFCGIRSNMHRPYLYLLGGDQLTTARVRGCQRICSNSEREADRLKGLVGAVEDWHAKQSFLGVS